MKYGYDTLGRRNRVSNETSIGTPSYSKTIDYLLSDGDQIGEILGATGQVTNRFMYGPGVDMVLSEQQFAGGVAQSPQYQLTDHLGTVRGVAQRVGGASSATLVNSVQYDAFGKVTSQSNATNQPHHGFAGRDIEPVGGLTYNRNRYYSTSSGRFISQDPIGFAAGDANLYRYVGNSPTNATDPSGLEEELIGWVYEISTKAGKSWEVQYVGKADELEKRFGNRKHPAARLLADAATRIRVKPIYAELDAAATSRGTWRAATDHAQRAVEQMTMGDDLPPLNTDRAASEANMKEWMKEQNARGGRFRRYNRGGFIALPDRPSMTSLATVGKTAGTGLVIVAEVASMADAINAPNHIEDYGDYFGQSPTHFAYQELFANAYMLSWHDASQQGTEREQQPFIDAYLSAPETRSPTLPIRPTSIGIMKEDLAPRARAYIDAQLHYRVMTSGNDLLEYQYSQWSMDKKVEMYKKWKCR